MTKKQENELAARGETAIGEVIDYGSDFGEGVDEIDIRECGIPFLSVVQQLSDCMKKATRIEGAEPGMFLNTGTQKLSDSVALVPAVRTHVYAVFKPREQGGGLLGYKQLDDPDVLDAIENQEFGKYKTPDGNELVETFLMYAIAIDAETSEPTGDLFVVPFKSTGIKRYKGIVKRMKWTTIDAGNGQRRSPPMFAHRLLFTTVEESKGSDIWYSIKPTFLVNDDVLESLLPPSAPAYIAAKQFAQLVNGGEVKIDVNSADSGDAPVDEEEEAGF